MSFFEKLLAKTCKTAHSLSNLISTDFYFSKIDESKPTIITIMTKYNCPMDIVIIKRTYLMKRKNVGWFRKKQRKFVLYQITGIVPDCFPDKVAQVMNSTMQIPALLSRFYDEKQQINAVASAFLDIKMSDILKQDKVK